MFVILFSARSSDERDLPTATLRISPPLETSKVGLAGCSLNVPTELQNVTTPNANVLHGQASYFVFCC